jgi:hypothetical protein
MAKRKRTTGQTTIYKLHTENQRSRTRTQLKQEASTGAAEG